MRGIATLEYQAHGRADFDLLATELRAALGGHALRVDHIGSTAIPGLCAKDVIDVQVTVRLLDVNSAQKLLQAGFTTHNDPWRHDHLPPGFEMNHEDGIKLFVVQRQGGRRSNIHVRQLGRPIQRHALLVRDFLREDQRPANANESLKTRLAAALADPEAYADVKDPAADLIDLAAERWTLERTGSQHRPAPSKVRPLTHPKCQRHSTWPAMIHAVEKDPACSS